MDIFHKRRLWTFVSTYLSPLFRLRISCTHIMCLDQIYPPFHPLQFLLYAPNTFPSQALVLYFLKTCPVHLVMPSHERGTALYWEFGFHSLNFWRKQVLSPASRSLANSSCTRAATSWVHSPSMLGVSLTRSCLYSRVWSHNCSKFMCAIACPAQ